ncbi:hypothetical protein SO694_00003452 [Aureococcus anophagefferens]|uniref:Uncharacterized protein n=1 Tax=Aureococcus anophagefferens TaxID=44056 RepID=A0ABR1GD33_AURAN
MTASEYHHLCKGDVVCGLLEAFKTRTLHYDQDKKRMSIKETSTAKDSGSVENIIESLIAARWRVTTQPTSTRGWTWTAATRA